MKCVFPRETSQIGDRIMKVSFTSEVRRIAHPVFSLVTFHPFRLRPHAIEALGCLLAVSVMHDAQVDVGRSDVRVA